MSFFDPDTQLRLQNGKYCLVRNIKPGDIFFDGAVITSILYKNVLDYIQLPPNDCISVDTVIWMAKSKEWCRAGDLYPIETLRNPLIFIGFSTSVPGVLESHYGNVFRNIFID